MEEMTLEEAKALITHLTEHHDALVALLSVRVEQIPLTEAERLTLTDPVKPWKPICPYAWCKLHGPTGTA